MRAFSGPIRYGMWILAGVVGMVALYWFLQRPAASSPYQTARVERGALAVTVTGEGVVQAKQSASLFWQASGVVEKVNVKPGDRVQKDGILATLERESLPQSILLAEADLAEAQRQLDDLLQTNTPAVQAWIALRDAQDAYDRAKRYYDSLFQPYSYEILTWKTVTFTIPLPTPQTITRTVPAFKTVRVQEADEETKADAKADLDLKAAQLEDARRAYERLKEGPDAVQLASLQARIAADQAILNMARIIAPFDGTVTQLNIQPGDLVTPGTFALRIDNLSHLYVNVSVSEIDVNQIQEGQEAIITLDGAPGKAYRGRIVEVSRVGTLQDQTVKFGVKVEILDPDEKVRLGMSATVKIVTQELQNVLLIPNRAIRLVDGKYTVYVLRQDKIQPLEIQLGPSGETMSALLGENLQEGELIVLNPPSNFRRNQGPPPFVRGRR